MNEVVLSSSDSRLIPNEVWAHIFQLVGKNFNEPLDISVTFELRVICKQWNNLILTFEKATILKPNSINSIFYLPNLVSLIIKAPCEIPNYTMLSNSIQLLSRLHTLQILSSGVRFSKSWGNFCLPNLRNLTLDQNHIASALSSIDVDIDSNFLQYVPSLTKLKVLYYHKPYRHLLGNLSCLTSLEKLVIPSNPNQNMTLNKKEFEKIFGVNLQIIENFSKLAYIRLPMLSFINRYEIQKRYPSIRFCWLSRIPNERCVYVISYEGNFSINNTPCGHGITKYSNGQTIEGNFTMIDGKREGFGKFTCPKGKYVISLKDSLKDLVNIGLILFPLWKLPS